MEPMPLSRGPSVKTEDRATAIPLHCILCPKKPTFSDVSHLLTHISSKSHLSHRFKLELRSKAESQARELLDRFEQWYAENRIERLLSDRLAAKEAKKPAKRGSRAPSAPVKRREVTVDREIIKAETDQQDVSRLPVMQRWNTLDHRTSGHLHGPRRDLWSESGFQTPVRQTRSIYSLPESPDTPTPVIKHENSQSAAEALDGIVATGFELAEDDIDTNGLKGDRLPGMRRFDAATDEQKRKRNQKKPPSVLQNMILSSQSVMPTEYVWDEDLSNLKRTRDIYDSPSVDGSPEGKNREDVKGSPVKKRQARRAQASQPTCTRRATRSSTSSAASLVRESEAATPGSTSIKSEASQATEDKPGTTASGDDDDDTNVFSDGGEATPLSAGHTASPQDEAMSEASSRPALQMLDPNISIAAPARGPSQDSQAYQLLDNKGSEHFSYPMPSQVPQGGYFEQAQHLSMSGFNLNPLSRESFAYNYGSPCLEQDNPFSLGPIHGLPFDIGPDDSHFIVPGHHLEDFDV